MSTESGGEASAEEQPTRWTAWALIAVLVLYPCLYCSGIMGEMVRPIISEHSRMHWWFFWLANMAFHWIPSIRGRSHPIRYRMVGMAYRCPLKKFAAPQYRSSVRSRSSGSGMGTRSSHGVNGDPCLNRAFVASD
jgi:hypothetical protein